MKELFKSSYILVLESFVFFFGQCVLPKRVANVQINVSIYIFLCECCREFAHVYRNTFQSVDWCLLFKLCSISLEIIHNNVYMSGNIRVQIFICALIGIYSVAPCVYMHAYKYVCIDEQTERQIECTYSTIKYTEEQQAQQ